VSANLGGESSERPGAPAGEMEIRAFARECAGDGATDGAARPVDDCLLAFEQHELSFLRWSVECSKLLA
jgi:hypothetical protein